MAFWLCMGGGAGWGLVSVCWGWERECSVCICVCVRMRACVCVCGLVWYLLICVQYGVCDVVCVDVCALWSVCVT